MSLAGQRIVVVMPAYNAARTLENTLGEFPPDLVDHVILVDDASHDDTADLARRLGLETHVHPTNRGYGGNQKTCYRLALDRQADIVVMIHPDYQYTPRLLRAVCSMIAEGGYDVVLGSRILCGGAWRGGMPRYKYVANRLLTAFENLCLGQKLSEYHTGYRAYRRGVLDAIDFDRFSEDFVFDNQMLAEIILGGWKLGELSCPTRYFAEASSINFRRSCRYGFGVLAVSLGGLWRRLTRRGQSQSPGGRCSR